MLANPPQAGMLYGQRKAGAHWMPFERDSETRGGGQRPRSVGGGTRLSTGGPDRGLSGSGSLGRDGERAGRMSSFGDGPGLEQAGGTLGPYTLIQEIGEGGFGVVWLAERSDPHMEVALKIIKPGMDSRAVLARFDRERRVLERLHHDGIARVIDGGMTDAGRPYFAMEFIDGVPITDFCDEHRLTVAQRVTLFGRVCDAVAHAHQEDVLHRDLKPSNILVALPSDFDAEEEPEPESKGPRLDSIARGGSSLGWRIVDSAEVKVIDFGIARSLAGDEPGATLTITGADALLGTPEYMAPEQAAGDRDAMDQRTDVYALGVILYELLLGTLPYETKGLRHKGRDEIRRFLCETPAAPPATRWRELDPRSRQKMTRHRSLRTSADLPPAITRELSNAVMHALALNPRDRTESARELKREIRLAIGKRGTASGSRAGEGLLGAGGERLLRLASALLPSRVIGRLTAFHGLMFALLLLGMGTVALVLVASAGGLRPALQPGPHLRTGALAGVPVCLAAVGLCGLQRRGWWLLASGLMLAGLLAFAMTRPA